MMILDPPRPAPQRVAGLQRQAGESDDFDEPLGAHEIAELPGRVVHLMTREELIRVIRAAKHLLPSCRCPPEQLSLRDRPTLERMAWLARYACQNVMATASPSRTANREASCDDRAHAPRATDERPVSPSGGENEPSHWFG
jgi:hypothetical protein